MNTSWKMPITLSTCGCKVSFDGAYIINYCSTHAAAPKLLAALEMCNEYFANEFMGQENYHWIGDVVAEVLDNVRIAQVEEV